MKKQLAGLNFLRYDFRIEKFIAIFLQQIDSMPNGDVDTRSTLWQTILGLPTK